MSRTDFVVAATYPGSNRANGQDRRLTVLEAQGLPQLLAAHGIEPA